MESAYAVQFEMNEWTCLSSKSFGDLIIHQRQMALIIGPISESGPAFSFFENAVSYYGPSPWQPLL